MEKGRTWTKRNADHEERFVFNLCRSRILEMHNYFPVVISKLHGEVLSVPLINRYGHVNDDHQV